MQKKYLKKIAFLAIALFLFSSAKITLAKNPVNSKLDVIYPKSGSFSKAMVAKIRLTIGDNGNFDEVYFGLERQGVANRSVESITCNREKNSSNIFLCPFNPALYKNGNYYIKAIGKRYGSSDFVSSASIITINNPTPYISLDVKKNSIIYGAKIINIQTNANLNSGSLNRVISNNNTDLISSCIKSKGKFTCAFNTKLLKNGIYNINASGSYINGAGVNTEISSPNISVTIKNPVPSININLKNNTTLKGKVNIANKVSNLFLSSNLILDIFKAETNEPVRFFNCLKSGSSYKCSIDTELLANGNYKLVLNSTYFNDATNKTLTISSEKIDVIIKNPTPELKMNIKEGAIFKKSFNFFPKISNVDLSSLILYRASDNDKNKITDCNKTGKYSYGCSINASLLNNGNYSLKLEGLYFNKVSRKNEIISSDVVLIKLNKPECTANLDCGKCKKCNNGLCVNDNSSSSKNECSEK